MLALEVVFPFTLLKQLHSNEMHAYEINLACLKGTEYILKALLSS